MPGESSGPGRTLRPGDLVIQTTSPGRGRIGHVRWVSQDRYRVGWSTDPWGVSWHGREFESQRKPYEPNALDRLRTADDLRQRGLLLIPDSVFSEWRIRLAEVRKSGVGWAATAAQAEALIEEVIARSAPIVV